MRACCIVLVFLAVGCKESPGPVRGGSGSGSSASGSSATPPLSGLAVELAELPVAELAARMASGTLTSRALTQAYLDRIAALDDAGPTLNAVIELNPAALRDADALDAERRAGEVRGPLHGIPVLIKDNVDVAGMVNSAGSLALAEHRPAKDAFLVARLREAGVVILGKTNLSEWANIRSTHSVSGWSSRGGQTRSPYALDRNPCGSSSGTGAGIAASLAAVGIGTETDGSIICPSSVAGLVGLKPTVGLVSRAGIIPISASQDTAGPMGRTVADVAALLAVIAAPDAADPASAAGGAPSPAPDYAAALRADALKGKRLGVLRTSMGYLPAVDAATEAAIVALRGAGAEVVDVELATAGKWDAPEWEVLLYELKDGLDRYLRDSGAPVASLAAVIAWNRAHAAVAMPHFAQEIFEQAQAKGPLSDEAYGKARDDARRLARVEGLEATLAAGKLDALIAPSVGPSWKTDPILGDHFAGSGYSVAAVAGTPSITVPMGADRGLPLGLVFLGPAYSEAALLGYAFAYEQATHARTAPTYAPTLER